MARRVEAHAQQGGRGGGGGAGGTTSAPVFGGGFGGFGGGSEEPETPKGDSFVMISTCPYETSTSAA